MKIHVSFEVESAQELFRVAGAMAMVGNISVVATAGPGMNAQLRGGGGGGGSVLPAAQDPTVVSAPPPGQTGPIVTAGPGGGSGPPSDEPATGGPGGEHTSPESSSPTAATDDPALKTAKTMRQLIRALHKSNPGNRVHMLSECNRLRELGEYPALDTVPDDLLEERVFSACDSMNIA